ncbi:hypothetical protein SEVIR_5G280200v4 [Setaria viridis]|uniref:Wall-associated receptor kinase galacturonan-binding domain-containing protein n=1 Tax=Setaria viridis TaxID=4556 RepID=A0A4U6UKY4_SETVI|nr:hypothetical protein SEVIR_5G280200v2 [Setaria viridis]
MALLLRHRLLLPPLLLLAILVAASHGAPSSGGDSYDTSMCVRQPYNCGNVNISYPFYSKMETLLGNDSSYCGYPGMEIQCEEGRAFLELDSGKYTVSRIDYEPPGVWLADPDVLNEGSCPRANHNVTLRNGSWLDYPNDTVDYLVFFINCNFLNVTDIARPPSNTDSTCKFDDEPAYGMSFVFRKEDVPHQDTNWWQVCGKVIEVPVLKSGLPTDPQNDPRWRNGGYGSSLREGFQLAWHQEHKAPSCDQCERSKGQCGYNKTGGYVACLCSGGRVGAPNCTTANSSGKPHSKLFQFTAGIIGDSCTSRALLELKPSPKAFFSRSAAVAACSRVETSGPTAGATPEPPPPQPVTEETCSNPRISGGFALIHCTGSLSHLYIVALF